VPCHPFGKLKKETIRADIRAAELMAKKKLPHGEAWLLEIAVTYHLSIASLTSSNLDNWLNRGHHHLSSLELRHTLRRMFDHGDIEAFYQDDDTYLCPSDERFFCPSNAQLEDAVNGKDRRLCYRLTVQGALRWESLANPNWNRYYEQSTSSDNSYELIAGSQERLLEIIRESKTLWGVIMCTTDLEIETLRPRQVAHWKTLPIGYRTLVEYTESSSVDVMEYVRQTPEEREKARKAGRRKYVRVAHWADSICGHAFV